MTVDYTNSFNFKPIPAITPLDGYWENGTWKFNMPEITAGAAYTPSWQDVTIYGHNAVNLINAKENGLNYLKLFGGTELIPQTYIDSVTANGGSELLPETYIDSVTAEGKCEQRNLPEGFTRVQFINSTQKIELANKTTNNSELEARFKRTSANNQYVYQSDASSSVSTNTAAYITSASGNWRFGAQTSLVSSDNFPLDEYVVTVQNKDGIFVNGEQIATYTNVNTFTSTSNLCALGTQATPNISLDYIIHRENGITIAYYVACRRNSDNVLGLYDLIGNTFYTNNEATITAGSDVTTPTPSQPINIYCNNGIIKPKKSSGLPFEYTLLNDLYGPSNTARINTGVSGNNDNLKIKIKCYAESFASYSAFFGNYIDEDTNTTRLIAGNSTTSGVIADLNRKAGNTTTNNKIKTTDDHEYYIYQDSQKRTILEVDGAIVDTIDYVVGTTNSTTIAINASRADSTSTGSYNKHYSYAQFWDGDTLIRNYLPALRNSDNKVGFYDTVNNTFNPSIGSDEFIAGTAKSDTIIYYVEGTQETVTDNVGNVATCQDLFSVGDYKDTQEILSGVVTRALGYKAYDGTESWTTDTYGGYRRFVCQDVIAVYEDTQNVICTHYISRGAGQREQPNSTFLSASGKMVIYPDSSQSISTVEDWKAFLSAQCKAGTPVAFVYPLVTATTDTVAGQVLQKSPVTYAGSLSGLTGTVVTSTHTVPTPTAPLQINCNNGVIKYSRNLFNNSNSARGYYNYNSSNPSADTNYRSVVLSLTAGTYTISQQVPTGTEKYAKLVRLNIYNTEIFGTSGQTLVSTPYTFTISSNAQVRFSFGRTDTEGGASLATEFTDNEFKTLKIQLEQGSTVTPYAPYPAGIYTDGTQETVTDSVGNVASCEILLAVSTYKDTQEVISGLVTHNIGVKILDGTEGWGLSTNQQRFYLAINDAKTTPSFITPSVCTHLEFQNVAIGDLTTGYTLYTTNNIVYLQVSVNNFSFSALNDFKQWLSDQYQAGTPVTIIYPLATATTETVSGQLLTKAPVTYAGSITGLTGTTVTSSHTVPTPTNPLEINCNNGVLKVSPNIITGDWALNKSRQSANGALYELDGAVASDIFAIQPNTDYACCYNGTAQRVRWYFYDSNKSYISGSYIADSATETSLSTAYYASVSIISQQLVNVVSQEKYKKISVNKGTSALPYKPYGQVYADGTQEKVEVFGKNLYNPATRVEDCYINASGVIVVEQVTNSCYSALIPVQPSATYVLSGTQTRIISANKRVHAYDSNGDWLAQLNYLTVTTDDTPYTVSFTTTSSTKYIRISILKTDTDVQVEQGSTATTYEPYYSGGSALAEMLLALDTFKDTQEILTGSITRQLGIKVLDGTEDISIFSSSGRNSVFLIHIADTGGAGHGNPKPAYSTHFSKSTSTITSLMDNCTIFERGDTQLDFFVRYDDYNNNPSGFKSWLADQYQAGQPVIVVFPLGTPTTESVTAQPLTIQEGTNIVEITEASMDDLALEVSYKAGVVVTVEEVENAQLDNSVEVTIQ